MTDRILGSQDVEMVPTAGGDVPLGAAPSTQGSLSAHAESALKGVDKTTAQTLHAIATSEQYGAPSALPKQRRR